MNNYPKRTEIWASFGQAFHGVFYTWKTQGHMRFHILAACIVVICGLIFEVKAWQWLFLVIAIGNVIAAEVFNTAIEIVVDLVQPDYHPLAGLAKDIAAGAVLVTAIQAVIIGLVVFWGPVTDRLSLIFS